MSKEKAASEVLTATVSRRLRGWIAGRYDLTEYRALEGKEVLIIPTTAHQPNGSVYVQVRPVDAPSTSRAFPICVRILDLNGRSQKWLEQWMSEH